MYKLVPTHSFKRFAKRLTKKDKSLKKKVINTLDILRRDPLYSTLRSHKVQTKKYGLRWSSAVTGDIRIIWDYSKVEKNAIELLDIGRHSGKRKIYK